MTKEEIIQRYHKEKDEGKIFFNHKSLMKSYGVMVVIACFLMIMSFLLTKESTIADIIMILLLPFVLIIYGTKAYYTRNKTYYFITCSWIFIYFFRIIDFMKEFF